MWCIAHGTPHWLVEKPSVFRQFTEFACSSKLETAQNRKVWVARTNPVLPTNYIHCYVDNLMWCIAHGTPYFVME